ncbi:unnamed protein product [Clonostachys chloroleuca]|uniref:HTH psq-type domain-containing protein n=1 Tax=Clonostachys chloroleuca TaxID=1926264 RepID=A0AA35QDF2_9HYPO|nr:unnamed protein product [Clonostachys chloroleuca]
MAIYSESEINSAINDILAGLSARVAAKKWAIPRITLRRRLEDGLTRAQAHEHQQRLSKAEEERNYWDTHLRIDSFDISLPRSFKVGRISSLSAGPGSTSFSAVRRA